MSSYISASGGFAAISHGDHVDFFRHGIHPPIKLKKSDLDRIISPCNDAIHLSDTNQKSVLSRLGIEIKKSDALMLLLTALDATIPDDAKDDVLACLEDLLGDKVIDLYLNSIMFSRPLPENNINEPPETLLEGLISTKTLIKNLLSAQPRIKSFYSRFLEICKTNNFDHRQTSIAEGILTAQSLAYYFLIGKVDDKNISTIRLDCLLKLQETDIPNQRTFNRQLFESNKEFVLAKKIDSTLQALKNNNSEDPLLDDSNNHRHKKSETPHKSFQQATAQIKKIKECLYKNDLDHAKKYINELVTAQVEKKDFDYAAQSLCQISEVAKKLRMFSLQLELAQRAIEIAPEDYRSYGHIADAYMNLGDLESARTFFNKSLSSDQLDNRIYGLIGLARIERELFNFDKGLEYINQSLNSGTLDSVPYTLKAEFLRDTHRLEDAATAYMEMIEKFPELSRPMCGLAAVYAHQKKLVEAEDVYRKAIKLYPEDKSVALSGLGFLLAKQARFQEAHRLLDESISLSEADDIIPTISKAKAFKLEGKFKQSEKILTTLILKSPHVLEAIIDLADLYLDWHDTVKAEEIINFIKKEFGATPQIQMIEVKLCKKRSCYADALSILDNIKAKYPRMILALLERAHIFKMSGDLVEARSQYKEVLGLNENERRAHMGLKIINQMEGNANQDVATDYYLEEKETTYEDYIQIGQEGLILLARGDAKNAKKLLLKSFNSGFGLLKEQFGSGLSVARVMLSQTAAIDSVKNPANSIDFVQQAIVYGEQNKLSLVEQSLAAAAETAPHFSKKIINFVENKYLHKSKSAMSLPDLLHEQVNVILQAA